MSFCDETPLLSSEESQSDTEEQTCPICLCDTKYSYKLSGDNFQQNMIILLNTDIININQFSCIPSCKHVIHFNCLLDFIISHLNNKKELYKRFVLQNQRSCDNQDRTYPQQIDFELNCPCCRVDLIKDNSFIQQVTNLHIQNHIDSIHNSIVNDNSSESEDNNSSTRFNIIQRYTYDRSRLREDLCYLCSMMSLCCCIFVTCQST